MIPARSRYKRGHWAKANASKRGLTPLPSPGDDIDAGDADLGDPDEDNDLDVPEWLLRGEQPPPAEDEPADREVPADRPPGHLKSPKGGRGAGAPRKIRVTATVRKDVESKIRVVLVPASGFWAMRDSFCGSTAQEQEPQISSALATIVCDSPDLLQWFTGPAGGFMKYFELFMALMPVFMAVQAHHVLHRDQPVRQVNPTLPPQMPAYAA